MFCNHNRFQGVRSRQHISRNNLLILRNKLCKRVPYEVIYIECPHFVHDAKWLGYTVNLFIRNASSRDFWTELKSELYTFTIQNLPLFATTMARLHLTWKAFMSRSSTDWEIPYNFRSLAVFFNLCEVKSCISEHLKTSSVNDSICRPVNF